MNSTYRVIWSSVLNTWIAVSELTKANGKSSASKLLKLAVVTLIAVESLNCATAIAAGISTPGPTDANALNSQWTVGSNGARRTDGLGVNALAGLAPYGLAVGNIARANSAGSISIGGDSTVIGTDSTAAIAIGSQAQVSGYTAISLGALAYSNANAVSVGAFTAATGQQSLSLGLLAGSTATNSTAIGTSALASGTGSIAFGSVNSQTGAGPGNVRQNTTTNTAATGVNAIAFGTSARATADNTLSLGASASASTQNSIALGNTASASGAQAMALGAGSSASQSGSVALGQGSVADRANAVSVGSTATQRQLIQVRAGTSGTDAVNVSQITPIIGGLGGGATFNVTTGVVTGPQYLLNQINATTGASSANGTPFTDVGSALTNISTSLANLSNSALRYADASTKTLITLGGTGGTRITNLTAGTLSATSTDAVNGSQLFSTNQRVSTLENTSASTLVRQSAAGQPITVGAATDGTSVSLTGTAGARTLNGLKDAALTATSDEAVTGRQLTATNTNVTTSQNNILAAANALGGGAMVNAQGVFVAPSYNVQGAAVNNVGDALTRLNTGVNNNTAGITNLTTAVNNISNGSVGLVQQNATNQSITVAAATGGTAISVAGTAGERKLSGLQDATLNATSNEAVTGRQLTTTNANVTKNTADIATNTSSIATNTSNIAANTTSIAANTTNIANNTSHLTGVAAALGGGAALGANGAFTAPSYSVQGGTVNNVGDALTRLNTGVNNNTAGITNLTTAVNNISNGSVGLVQQNATNQSITVAAATGGTAISVAGTAGERKLSGLQDATLNATSNEAVTGRQLTTTNANVTQNTADIATNTSGIATNATNIATNTASIAANTTNIANNASHLTGVAAALGGGAALGADGAFTAPSYSVQGGAVNNVGDALTRLDSGVTTNNNAISNLAGTVNNISNGSVGLVRQDATSQAITVAAATGGTSVSVAGTDGERTLSGLKDATLDTTSNEAVTGRQLTATNANVTQNTADIAANTSSIATNSSNIAANTTNIANNASHLTGVAAALGGGAALGADGAFTAPSYSIQGGAVNNVGDALSRLDTGVTTNASGLANLANTVNNIGNGSVGLVRQDATSQAITVAAATGGTSVSVAGTDGERTLSGLKDATLDTTSNEAVTGRQLTATNANVTQNTADIAANTSSIATNSSNIAANATNIANNASHLTGVAAALGGGAALGADGAFTAPSYSIQGSAVNNVGDALSRLDTGVTTNASGLADLANTVNSIGNGSVGLVRQDATSQAITVAAATGGTSVSVAGTDGERTLSGLKDATLEATSNEAVTGRQLTATNANVTQNTADIATNTSGIATNSSNIAANTTSIANNASHLTGVAAALGGGAALGADGAFTAPSYSVQGGAVNNVGDALTRLDSGVTTNNNAISNLAGTVNNISNGSVGLVRQDATSQAITVAAATGGTSVSVAGTDGERTLSGLKDATLDATSNEAVTGRQLTATNANVTQNTADIAANTSSITTNSSNIAANTTNIANNASHLTGVAAALGGGAALGADGAFTAPSYSVQGGMVNNVGDALTRLDTGITTNASGLADLANTVNNIGTGGVGLVRQDATSKAITVAAATGGTSVSVAGIDGERTLSGLKDATLDTTSNEAVTGRQLTATNANVTQNTADIAANTSSIATNSSNIAANTTNIANNASHLTGVAAALGGGTALGADGAFTAPSYSIQGGAVNNVGDALTLLDSGVTTNASGLANLANTVNNIGNGSIGLVRQDATSQAITIAAATGGTSVSVAGTDGERTLSGLKDAELTPDSDEAVTGRQLTATNNIVSTNSSNLALVAESFGGGSSIDSAGNFTAPTYVIQGNTVHNLGDALGGLDQGLSTAKAGIADLTNTINNGGVGLVRQDATSQDVSVGSTTGGTVVSVAGTDGERTLNGLKDAALTSTSNEAVTGRQLAATNANVAQNTTDIANLNGVVDGISNGSVGLVKQDATDQSISVGKDKGGSSISLTGTDGDRTLTGLKEGVSDNDAVTVSQLKNASGSSASNDSSGNGIARSLGNDSVAVGPGAVSSGANSSALGTLANAGGDLSTAVGSNANASQSLATAVGSNSTASAQNSTAVGSQSSASGNGSTALGQAAVASGSQSLALGSSSNATGVNSSAVGAGSKASNDNSVAIGSNSITSRDNTVSFGSSGSERQLTNVAAGTQSTDAVNVGQMNQAFSTMNNSVNRALNNMDRKINDLDDKLTGGIASAMAMTGIPQAYQPNSSLVGASVSSYKDAGAIAVGVSKISANGKWVLKLNGSGNTQSDFGVAAGIGYQW